MIKIEISVKKIRYAGQNEEEYFLAYKGFTKRGWVDLKFTKECKNIPLKNSFIYVEKENVNVNKTGRFPIIWVKDVDHFEEIKFEQKVEDYFQE